METVNQIKLVLNRIRPFIQGDGGDVEFVRYEENMKNGIDIDEKTLQEMIEIGDALGVELRR